MILVIGATGTNGGEIVKQLRAAGAPVRALVRAPKKEAEKVAALQRQGVEIVEGDLAQPETLDRAFEGAEKAFLLSSVDPHQVELQGNLIDSARRAGLGHLVKFSAMGADPNSPFMLNKWHGQTEQQIKDSGIPFRGCLKSSKFVSAVSRKWQES